jgi:hypothetical protein
MWQLDNRTPYAAERTWVRDKDGAEIWLVAVKCTFDIKQDGTTEVAKEQPPVVMAPEYMNPDDPAKSSLKYDSDLVRTKTTTDIIVNGQVYAPNGQPVTELDIGFRVGTLTKLLKITGDRIWQDGSITKPKPFTVMPIIYERAFGGFNPQSKETPASQWDMRNPLGTGFALSSEKLNDLPLPNIEYPDQLIKSWKDRPNPAGFGPICSHWQPRVNLTGTYDDKWQQERLPLLPLDFDDRHYQCAPTDQQTPQFLQGDEPVALLNLTPQGKLHFKLPRVILGFETFFYTGERQLHERPKLHTVIIEPDFSRVSLVWHSALPCHPKVLKLKETRIIQKRLLSTSPAQEVEMEEEA